ncbi:hypothetical protein ACLK19_23995 [Escherichia coli]
MSQHWRNLTKCWRPRECLYLKEPEEIKLAMQVVVLRDKLEPSTLPEGRYQDALVENWQSCVSRLMLSSIK